MSVRNVPFEVPLACPVSNPDLLAGFADNSRPAVLKIGEVVNRELFSAPVDLTKSIYYQEGRFAAYLSCKPDINPDTDAPIYDVPEPLRQFGEAIIKIAQFEHSNFPETNYARIRIVAKQSYVPPFTTQLASEKHRDEAPLLAVQHPGEVVGMRIYTVADRKPTIFCNGNKEVAANPYDIVASTQETFHRSPFLMTGGVRTFFYMSFAFGVPRFEYPVRALSMQ
jgi:hypothetical protein